MLFIKPVSKVCLFYLSRLICSPFCLDVVTSSGDVRPPLRLCFAFDSSLIEAISVPEVDDTFSDRLESKLRSWLSCMLDFILTSGSEQEIAFFCDTEPSLNVSAASRLTI